MPRLLCLLAALAAGAGCSKPDDAAPNPDLKAPDVKPERGPGKPPR